MWFLFPDEPVLFGAIDPVKLVAKSKLYGGNLIKAINASDICVVRYSAEILDWNDRKLKAMAVHETEGWREGINHRL